MMAYDCVVDVVDFRRDVSFRHVSIRTSMMLVFEIYRKEAENAISVLSYVNALDDRAQL